MSSLKTRIEDLKKQSSFQKNCFSAALFLSGITPFEIFSESTRAGKIILDAFEKLPHPEKGAIVAYRSRFQRDWYIHYAIVKSTNPVICVHRDARLSPVEEIDLMKLDKQYGPINRAYFRPKKPSKDSKAYHQLNILMNVKESALVLK